MHDFEKFKEDLETMRKGYAKLPDAAKKEIERHRALLQKDIKDWHRKNMVACYLMAFFHAGIINSAEYTELNLYASSNSKYAYCDPK